MPVLTAGCQRAESRASAYAVLPPMIVSDRKSVKVPPKLNCTVAAPSATAPAPPGSAGNVTPLTVCATLPPTFSAPISVPDDTTSAGPETVEVVHVTSESTVSVTLHAFPTEKFAFTMHEYVPGPSG